MFTPFAFVKQEIAGGFDPDAQAFINATGITGTDANAINNLVFNLKFYNLWNNMLAIYPFVSSSATTQKYNLKDPQDTDAAYRIAFNGTWTHDASGADPGANGWGNTFVKPYVHLTGSGQAHMSVLLAENAPGNAGYDMGCYGGTNAAEWAVISSFGNNTAYASMNILSAGYTTYSNTNTIGHYITSFPSGSTLYAFKDGAQTAFNSRTYAPPHDVTLTIALGASNRPGNNPTDFGQRKMSFATIGEGLDGTQAANLYVTIDYYNTEVGR